MVMFMGMMRRLEGNIDADVGSIILSQNVFDMTKEQAVGDKLEMRGVGGKSVCKSGVLGRAFVGPFNALIVLPVAVRQVLGTVFAENIERF